MAEYSFGEIPGNPEGSVYVDRDAVMKAHVHQVKMQGISGNRLVGANSVVVNGGYEDDDDFGDVIIYTGAGGNDPATKKQIADQTFDQVGNAGLVISEINGLPVRVIRGSRGEPAHRPASGFRYDGLYRVDSHWYEEGKSGFKVCRYRLIKLDLPEAAPFLPVPSGPSQQLASPPAGSSRTNVPKEQRPGALKTAPGTASFSASTPPVGSLDPGRSAGVTVRLVRDTAVSNWVKALYEYACQICDDVLDLPVGKYAEGAHVRALGKPHNGPDTVDNVLCLCPTHHVLFDKGALHLSDDFAVYDHHNHLLGQLTRHPAHPIDVAHIRYHRAATGH